MMMRREEFLDLGGFYEPIWMYGEEADLCAARARPGRPAPGQRDPARPRRSRRRLRARGRACTGARATACSTPAATCRRPALARAVASSAAFDALTLAQVRNRSAFRAVLTGWRDGLRLLRSERRARSRDEKRRAASRLSSMRAAMASSGAWDGSELVPVRALITGIGGQDGSYLAELLLEKGYDVAGTVLGSPDDYPALEAVRTRLRFVELDLTDVDAVGDVASVAGARRAVPPRRRLVRAGLVGGPRRAHARRRPRPPLRSSKGSAGLGRRHGSSTPARARSSPVPTRSPSARRRGPCR